MSERPAPTDADRFRNVLAFALIAAFIAAIGLLIFKTLAPENRDIITYMVGQLSGMATTALGFYFVNKVGQDALENKRADNTGKLADAVVAAANATPPLDRVDAGNAADAVAEAATDKAEDIKAGGLPYPPPPSRDD